MPGMPSILLLFRNKFNKFIYTGAQMLDSIYHMTLKYLIITFLERKSKDFPSFTQRYISVNRFYCMALYHSQRRRHVMRGCITDMKMV